MRKFARELGVPLLEVKSSKKVIGFKKAIIAAGSQAVRLPFMPQDPRVVDSTGALELTEVPKRLLILGGGIIGLEMGTVYSTLGVRLDVVEMLDGPMQGADPRRFAPKNGSGYSLGETLSITRRKIGENLRAAVLTRFTIRRWIRKVTGRESVRCCVMNWRTSPDSTAATGSGKCHFLPRWLQGFRY